MADDVTVPTVREFSILTAALHRRLRRFYYRNLYVDAIDSGWTGTGGGKVDTQLLRHMSNTHGWLEPMPDESPWDDSYWKLTDAGREARQRYLEKRRGKR